MPVPVHIGYGTLGEGLRFSVLVPLVDLFPIDHIEEGLRIFRTPVLVFQVVRVLPHIEHQQGNDAPLSQILVFFRLQDHQVVHLGLIGQNAPAGTFYGIGSGLELGRERVEAAEGFVNRLGDIAGGLSSTRWAHDFPKNGV